MTIEQVVLSIITALIVNVPSYFMLRETRRKMAAEAEERRAAAKSTEQETAGARDRLEQEITERVLASSNAELDRMTKRIETQDKQIGILATKIVEKDNEMAEMRRGFQEQIDKLAEMVRQLVKQLQAIGHEPQIDMTEFSRIEERYRK